MKTVVLMNPFSEFYKTPLSLPCSLLSHVLSFVLFGRPWWRFGETINSPLLIQYVLPECRCPPEKRGQYEAVSGWYGQLAGSAWIGVHIFKSKAEVC